MDKIKTLEKTKNWTDRTPCIYRWQILKKLTENMIPHILLMYNNSSVSDASCSCGWLPLPVSTYRNYAVRCPVCSRHSVLAITMDTWYSDEHSSFVMVNDEEHKLIINFMYIYMPINKKHIPLEHISMI